MDSELYLIPVTKISAHSGLVVGNPGHEQRSRPRSLPQFFADKPRSRSLPRFVDRQDSQAWNELIDKIKDENGNMIMPKWCSSDYNFNDSVSNSDGRKSTGLGSDEVSHLGKPRERPRDRIARHIRSRSMPRNNEEYRYHSLPHLPSKQDLQYKSLPHLTVSTEKIPPAPPPRLHKSHRYNTMPHLNHASRLLTLPTLDHFTREELMKYLNQYSTKATTNLQERDITYGDTKSSGRNGFVSYSGSLGHVDNMGGGGLLQIAPPYDYRNLKSLRRSYQEYNRQSSSDKFQNKQEGSDDDSFGMSVFGNQNAKLSKSSSSDTDDNTYGMADIARQSGSDGRPWLPTDETASELPLGYMSMPLQYRQRPRIRDYFPQQNGSSMDYSVKSAMDDRLNLPDDIRGNSVTKPRLCRQTSEGSNSADFMRSLGESLAQTGTERGRHNKGKKYPAKRSASMPRASRKSEENVAIGTGTMATPDTKQRMVNPNLNGVVQSGPIYKYKLASW